MSKTASTAQLNVDENLLTHSQSSPYFLTNKNDEPSFLSPYLQRLRALLPQSYLLPRTYGVDNPLNKILQQANQSRNMAKTASFFRVPIAEHQKRQTNKRKATANHFLSAVNTSEVVFDILPSLEVAIPSDQLDAMIQDLQSDFCESAQKKIKIELSGL